MRPAFHLVNGILNFPGSSKNWNGRGVTWLHTDDSARELAARAEKIEYFCGPIGRAFGQKKRAHKLYRTLEYYREWQNTLAGHSNGADVILSMLRDYLKWPDIHHLILLCGACNADFEKNGLNRWLREGRVKRVTVGVAGLDMALRLAHSLPGKLLGYGTLGLHGPLNVAEDIRDRVQIIWSGPWQNYGHSSCWEPHHFSSTMRLIAGLEIPTRHSPRITPFHD